MLILDITQKDVQKSLQSKIFSTTKNTVVESLWQHPLLVTFLLKENETAVEYLNQGRGQITVDAHFEGVTYYLVKRTAMILLFLKNEMNQVLLNRTSSFHHSNQVEKFMGTTTSMFGFVDELHAGVPFTRQNLDTLRGDKDLKTLFQLWLLMYGLAEKENVEKGILEEASLALRTLLEGWRA